MMNKKTLEELAETKLTELTENETKDVVIFKSEEEIPKIYEFVRCFNADSSLHSYSESLCKMGEKQKLDFDYLHVYDGTVWRPLEYKKHFEKLKSDFNENAIEKAKKLDLDGIFSTNIVLLNVTATYSNFSENEKVEGIAHAEVNYHFNALLKGYRLKK